MTDTGTEKFQLQFASDLHLEHYGDNINMCDFLIPVCDNLALLGDIGYPGDKNYVSFIDQCSQNFKRIFIISGNHEYYICKSRNLVMNKVDKLIHEICGNYTNVFFLNNSAFEINNDVVIIGTTLWSYIPNNSKEVVEMMINDYKNIYTSKMNNSANRKLIDANDINDIFQTNLDWLVNKVKSHIDKKIIIISHHTPSYKSIALQFKDHPANCAFANDLDKLISELANIKIWLFGHTHASMTFMINNTFCCSNPKGYRNENSKYENNKVITL